MTPDHLSPHYPAFRYHRTKEPVVIHSPEAEEALGEGWANTPAAFQDEENPLAPPSEEELPQLSDAELNAAVDDSEQPIVGKPKLVSEGGADDAVTIHEGDIVTIAAEKPRRGRPAGSKNKLSISPE